MSCLVNRSDPQGPRPADPVRQGAEIDFIAAMHNYWRRWLASGDEKNHRVNNLLTNRSISELFGAADDVVAFRNINA